MEKGEVPKGRRHRPRAPAREPPLLRGRHGLAGLLSQWDESGRLRACFDQPTVLTDEQARTCMEEEGWILGSHLPAGRRARSGPHALRVMRESGDCIVNVSSASGLEPTPELK